MMQSSPTPVPGYLTQRDKDLIAQLQFSSYTSPIDSVQVEVPELPQEDNSDTEDEFDDLSAIPAGRKRKHISPEMREAVRLRNIALRRQRKEMDLAWASWQKPLLKPGDLVAILKPCAPLTDSASRLFSSTDFGQRKKKEVDMSCG